MVQIKRLAGLSPYEPVWESMKAFTEQRTPDTEDQIWQVEHLPVYTLGQAGKPEHILNPGKIPVVHCNRGGQVTYHGPGQAVIYPLVDLHRLGMFVKEYVKALEEAIILTLADFGIPNACRKEKAPGVYVPMEGGVGDGLAKIAALGVKVTKGWTYHGMAINVDMDLSPFLGINPCGYVGLKTIDMKTLGVQARVDQVSDCAVHHLCEQLY